MDVTLQLLSVNRLGRVRREVLNGRTYLVAPCRMIVPGVLPGSKGPLLYPKEEVGRDPMAWNHMPIVLNHPKKDGEWCSARSPDVLEPFGLGYVFNAYQVEPDGFLDAESWFDVEKCRQVAPTILQRVAREEPLELSTGLFTDNEPAPPGATYNGREYTDVARNYRPDHLAILTDTKGACSQSDGCGVLINEEEGDQLFAGQTTDNSAEQWLSEQLEQSDMATNGELELNFDPDEARDESGKWTGVKASTHENLGESGNPDKKFINHYSHSSKAAAQKTKKALDDSDEHTPSRIYSNVVPGKHHVMSHHKSKASADRARKLVESAHKPKEDEDSIHLPEGRDKRDVKLTTDKKGKITGKKLTLPHEKAAGKLHDQIGLEDLGKMSKEETDSWEKEREKRDRAKNGPWPGEKPTGNEDGDKVKCPQCGGKVTKGKCAECAYTANEESEEGEEAPTGNYMGEYPTPPSQASESSRPDMSIEPTNTEGQAIQNPVSHAVHYEHDSPVAARHTAEVLRSAGHNVQGPHEVGEKRHHVASLHHSKQDAQKAQRLVAALHSGKTPEPLGNEAIDNALIAPMSSKQRYCSHCKEMTTPNLAGDESCFQCGMPYEEDHTIHEAKVNNEIGELFMATLTAKRRSEMIKDIVTNCDCAGEPLFYPEDVKMLANVSDERLNRLHKFQQSLVTINAKVKGDDDEEEETEDEEEGEGKGKRAGERADNAAARVQKPKQMSGKGGAAFNQQVNKWLKDSNAPPEVAALLTNALGAQLNQHQMLINQIVSDPRAQMAGYNQKFLAKKEPTELQMIANVLGIGQHPMVMAQPVMTPYYGASDFRGAAAPLTNEGDGGGSPAEEAQGLVAPTNNYEDEWAARYPKYAHGRGTTSK